MHDEERQRQEVRLCLVVGRSDQRELLRIAKLQLLIGQIRVRKSDETSPDTTEESDEHQSTEKQRCHDIGANSARDARLALIRWRDNGAFLVRRSLALLFSGAFSAERRARAWLLLAFVLVNGAVLLNALTHDPRIAYDAGQHLTYVDILATGRLPLRAETAAYYSPPLPYVVPALVRRLTGASLLAAARAGLVFQFLLSTVLISALLVTCERLRPGDGGVKLVALGLCGMPAVYYRTFAMIRGEPYLATLATLLVAGTLGTVERRRLTMRDVLLTALLCGGIALARQLGALLLLGWGVFALSRVVCRVPRWAMTLATSILVVALASGWFYSGLRDREGTVIAWNVPRAGFAFANQPREFYLGTGSGALFSAPGRPRFQKQLLPVLHADWWGDYWHYFLFRGRRSNGMCVSWPAPSRPNAMPVGDEDFTGNYGRMLRYLGVLNAFALLPAGVILAGLASGLLASVALFRTRGELPMHTQGAALAFLMAAATMLGFFWFVISYPRQGDGDTVKATYVFQLVPLCALLGAEAMARLRTRSRSTFRVVAALLVVCAVLASPTWVSRWRPPLDCLLPSYGRQLAATHP